MPTTSELAAAYGWPNTTDGRYDATLIDLKQALKKSRRFTVAIVGKNDVFYMAISRRQVLVLLDEMESGAGLEWYFDIQSSTFHIDSAS